MISRFFAKLDARFARARYFWVDKQHAAGEPRADEVAPSKHFCMAPWVHLFADVDGVTRPCTEIQGDFGNLQHQSIAEIWEGEPLQKLRSQLLRDRKLPACSRCQEVEACGGTSTRQNFNKKFSHHEARVLSPAAQGVPIPQPVSFDIRFSNLCNFSCRMCWHKASSKWYDDAVKLGLTNGSSPLIRAFADQDEAISAIRPLLDTVEHIYFAGGEPLLMKEHYGLLAELLARGRRDVVLSYNSNISHLGLGQTSVLDLWSQFDKVNLQASIDAAGARGELIRQGLVWEDFVNNLQEIRRRCPHVSVCVGVTVSVFNVAALGDLVQTLTSRKICPAESIGLHVLQEWKGYRVTVLPRAIKSRIADDLSRLAQTSIPALRDQLNHIIAYMMATDDSYMLHEFRDKTLKLDALRGHSTAAICPELAPLLDEMNPIFTGLRSKLRQEWRRWARIWIAPLSRQVRRVIARNRLASGG